MNATDILINISFNSSNPPMIDVQKMYDALFIQQYCGRISTSIFFVFAAYWVAFTVLYLLWLYGDKIGVSLSEERYHWWLERLQRSYGVLGFAACLYLAFYVF